MKRRTTQFGLILAVASALVLSACATPSGNDGNTDASDAPLRSLTVKFDYTPIQGFMLPIVVAMEKGYYKEVGLDVTASEGESANSTISAIDGGHFDIGFADSGAAALAISKGADIKVFAVYLQETYGSVISREAEGITKPEDLIGKTVAATDGSSSGALLDAMLKINGIPRDQVNVQSVASSAKVASLLQGQVDAITGFLTSECIQAKDQSTEPIYCMPVGEFGVTSLGIGLLASKKLVEGDAKMLTDFVEATNRGWEDALKDPEAAAEIGVKHFPLADKALLTKQLSSVEPLLHTNATEGKPYGYMAESDWDATLEFLHAYRGLDQIGDPSSYYMNVIE